MSIDLKLFVIQSKCTDLQKNLDMPSLHDIFRNIDTELVLVNLIYDYDANL